MINNHVHTMRVLATSTEAQAYIQVACPSVGFHADLVQDAAGDMEANRGRDEEANQQLQPSVGSNRGRC